MDLYISNYVTTKHNNVIIENHLPDKAMVLIILLSKGGDHIPSIADMAGYVTPCITYI